MYKVDARCVCKSCLNLKNKKYCILKKTSVAINKKRSCTLYKHNPNFVEHKTSIPTTRTISWNLSAVDRKKLLEESKKELDMRISEDYKTNSVEHPLTGDISQFKSTRV